MRPTRCCELPQTDAGVRELTLLDRDGDRARTRALRVLTVGAWHGCARKLGTTVCWGDEAAIDAPQAQYKGVSWLIDVGGVVL